MSKPLTKRDPRKGQLLYTRQEAADLLACSLTTLDALTAAREIKAEKYKRIGKRIPHSALIEFVETQGEPAL